MGARAVDQWYEDHQAHIDELSQELQQESGTLPLPTPTPQEQQQQWRRRQQEQQAVPSLLQQERRHVPDNDSLSDPASGAGVRELAPDD